ncbi:RNA-binding S4 domain-containing protein [Camelliibacillus cellulosilyticus]|uniref:RQC P-site tRNA stabilizing factor n=1 Tax=Camelliibacillus cellulosilyticus TaxID=2174486 RepID=A0ABV9GQS0_9BACL
MRLDKFLKVSRLIKRRTVAKELADKGRVVINGRAAKAASDIQIGDVLEIHFGQKTLTVKVKDLQESPKKEEAGSLYEVLSEESSVL